MYSGVDKSRMKNKTTVKLRWRKRREDLKTIHYSFVLWVIFYNLQLRCKEAVEVVEETKNSTLLTAHILCQVYTCEDCNQTSLPV